MGAFLYSLQAVITSGLVATISLNESSAIRINLVGDEGLEPPTSSLSVTRSNQLS